MDALQRAGLPFIAVLNDPTYGGVSASYAMQADVKIAVSDARIGFAGPQVINDCLFWLPLTPSSKIAQIICNYPLLSFIKMVKVILNTMCEADQQLYDKTCPADFQSAEYVWEHG